MVYSLCRDRLAAMLDRPSLPTVAVERHGGAARSELVFVALGLATLLAAQLVLTNVIQGTNYPGADGKAAQATILAMLEFARWLDVNTLNPLQGIGSQTMPMNVWLNPSYWPFAFAGKETAATLSGLMALGIYATFCFAFARCFQVPVIPAVLAAQSCMLLFGPTVLILTFGVVFSAIPGLAVVYAPHLLALGLLNRLQAGRSQFVLITAGILLLICWSLAADPLWTMVSAIAWTVPFAVVTFAPLRREAVLMRCAAMGTCLAVLLLSGALEYAYTLSQYTARVQFPQLLRRAQLPEFASVLFSSPYAVRFYGSCGIGWLLGVWLLRGSPRILVLAATASALTLAAYSFAYLMQEGTWWLPLPIYIEHAVFALFMTAAIAGYWGALEALVSFCRGRIRTGDANTGAERLWRGVRGARRQAALPAIAMALCLVFLPGLFTRFGISFNAAHAKFAATYWNEPWPDQPELRDFLAGKIGLGTDRRFRGSAYFFTGGADEFRTLGSLWVDRVPTVNEYSQLVSPQSVYLFNALFKDRVNYQLNWFPRWMGSGGSDPLLFRTLGALGARYIAGYDRVPEVETAQLASISLPRRPYLQPAAHWVIYELSDVNTGDYSPTEVTTAGSAADIIAVLESSGFDYKRRAVLSAELPEELVPASDMRLSIHRGALHVSGHSNATSLALLPQQFSNCLRVHDERARLVRADLMLTGLVFSGEIDTKITFDYGIFLPRCRRADLADIEKLGIQLRDRSASHAIAAAGD
jgi:hypothetical protein